LQRLLKELKDINYPIVFVANDPWNSKFSELRKKCKLIEFSPLNYSVITLILKEILKKEKLNLDENFLKKISIKSKGDVRAAINDLMVLTSGSIIDLDEREKEEDIFSILKTIFKSKDIEKLKNIFDNSKEDLDEIFLWIDENISKDYSKEDLEKAYYYLSKADIFRKRIMKQQHWRFMYYQNLMMSFGIGLSKKNGNNKFTSYTRTQRLLKIWINNQKNAERNDLIKKISPKLHLSNKKLIRELPYMRLIFKNIIFDKDDSKDLF
jgi:replication factor C large subunit